MTKQLQHAFDELVENNVTEEWYIRLFDEEDTYQICQYNTEYANTIAIIALSIHKNHRPDIGKSYYFGYPTKFGCVVKRLEDKLYQVVWMSIPPDQNGSGYSQAN